MRDAYTITQEAEERCRTMPEITLRVRQLRTDEELYGVDVCVTLLRRALVSEPDQPVSAAP